MVSVASKAQWRREAAQLFNDLELALEKVVREFAQELKKRQFTRYALKRKRPLVDLRVDDFRYVLIRLPVVSARALTEREHEIALLILQDHSNKEIAERLGIRIPTVASHLRRIYAKFDVSSRTSLVTTMIGTN